MSVPASSSASAWRDKLLPAGLDAAGRAADMLAAGKLLILPTETVYGVAFSLLSPDANRRVRALKPLADKPGWVIHLGQVSECLSWVPGISGLGRRLLTKSLPGPIAFQIVLTEPDLAAAKTRLGDLWDESIVDGAITLRCPDCAPTQDILSRAVALGHPIAMIGTGGRAPAHELADVPEAVIGAADAAVDGGPTRYRKPSTLVRIEGERFQLVRPGVIDQRIVQRLADFMILFVCSGNTCRSPMAAALAAKLLAERLGIPTRDLAAHHIVVQSAGVYASRGLPAAREAVQALADLGAELGGGGGHLSQPATNDLLRRADVIYTMTQSHRDEILDLMPAARDKTCRLDLEADVEDPIGAGVKVYRQVAERLQELIKRRLDELKI
jgi:protein-tyrosine-phosphatase/tRNA A37 threonylcarbamoyladenosine synthetase subunit TsaC/SUA5/YrdC